MVSSLMSLKKKKTLLLDTFSVGHLQAWNTSDNEMDIKT